MPSSSKFTTTQSHTLAYTKFPGSGDKPAIVFIHGLGSSENYYYSIAKAINAQGFTCLTFDNYGASKSPLSNIPLTTAHLEVAVKDTVELIQNQGFKKIILIGHSMGGMIANYITSTKTKSLPPGIEVIKVINMSTVHPNKVLIGVFNQRVKMLEDTGDMVKLATGVSENAVGSLCSDLKKAFIRELVSSQSTEGYIYNSQIIVSTSSRNEETSFFNDIYAAISCPMLVLCGEEDKAAPWTGCVEEIYKAVSRNNTSVSVKTFHGVGHWMAIEDHEAVIEAVSGFVS